MSGPFGPTGTLGDLINSLLPALLKLFHRLQRGLAVLGDLGRDALPWRHQRNNFPGFGPASSTASVDVGRPRCH